ncbi:MAG: VOC family protein [Pseudomonadales bacterium]
MQLSKKYIDIGIQTNQRDSMLEFWGSTIGLPYEELLKVGGGIHQHRHTLNGSVFKLNNVREPLNNDDKSGFKELMIAREGIDSPQEFSDPDGNKVTLVPVGFRGISHIAMNLEVSSIRTFQHFYREVLQIEEISETCFKWGSTLLFLTENVNHPSCAGFSGIGYRYITVQVFDVEHEHQGFLDRGGNEARPPRTLGQTARISMITDPDGNWIEISQRASLTGPVPQDSQG